MPDLPSRSARALEAELSTIIGVHNTRREYIGPVDNTKLYLDEIYVE